MPRDLLPREFNCQRGMKQIESGDFKTERWWGLTPTQNASSRRGSGDLPQDAQMVAETALGDICQKREQSNRFSSFL